MRRWPDLPQSRAVTVCRRRHTTTAGAVVLMAVVLSTRLASAGPMPPKPSPEGPPAKDKPGVAAAPLMQASSGTGFAFGAPRGAILFKGGWLVPRADSDIFTFNAELLTLDSNSFGTGLFGMDVLVALGNRVDLVFGVEYSRSAPVSEFRDFVDEFDAPIAQQTRITQIPLTASARVYLTERGRAVGNFAWVPAKAVPYVGGGAGITRWRYEQFGDFVDFADFTIFTDTFMTQGWEPLVQVFGGLDANLTPRIALNFEGRYSWADGQLAPAFVGFEPIDLAGFRATVGVAFRF